MSTPEEILIQFIEDEAHALYQEKQGFFWPSNHHHITPLIVRAHKILKDEMLVELYFHLLRLNHKPAMKCEEAFSVLLAAYRRITPLFCQGYPIMMLSRLEGLLLFGFNDLCQLQDEPPITLEHYQKYLTLWRYINSFSHVPGMLKKRSKFLQLSEEQNVVKRIEKVLCMSPLSSYLPFPSGGPWLWAMVFLALHNHESGLAVVRKLVNEELSPDKRASTHDILRRYLVTASRMDLSGYLVSD